MRILTWLNALFGGRRERPRGVQLRNREPAPRPDAHGDMRGSYGFGRRAHRPDPKGRFSFDNDANRWARHPYG